MKGNSTFYKSFNKIIKGHLKVNKGILIFFGVTWTVLSLILLSLPLSDGKLRIAEWYEKGVSFGPSYGLGTATAEYLFGGVGFIYFSVVSLVLANSAFTQDIKSNRIVFWKTLPVSKNNLFISKAIFIISSNLIIMAPSFFYDVILTFASKDFNKNGLSVFIYLLQFLFFIILMASAITCLSVLLRSYSAVFNIVCSFLIIFILFTWIMRLIYFGEKVEGDLPKTIKIIHYISIISPENLVSNNLWFIRPSEAYHVDNYVYVKFDLYKNYEIAIKTVLMPILSVGMLTGITYYFKSIDLNI